MPYKNQHNANIAQEAQGYAQSKFNRENQINDFTSNYEVPSQLESAVLHNANVHGGSGYAAATVGDLGIEPTAGATGDGKRKRVRKKTIEVGEGLSAAGKSAGTHLLNMTQNGPPDMSGGAMLSLKDMYAMHGQPPDAVRAKTTVKSMRGSGGVDRAVGGGVSAGGVSAGGVSAGGGSGRANRNAIVRDVMQKQGLSLPAASKYVKEHNLY